jgi:hypothetical protein
VFDERSEREMRGKCVKKSDERGECKERKRKAYGVYHSIDVRTTVPVMTLPSKTLLILNTQNYMFGPLFYFIFVIF